MPENHKDTTVTNGIQISVETFYQADISSPRRANYVFAYRITIDNKSPYTVQILRRHWFIYDSLGDWSEVEGEGIVGQQPVLEPGDRHQYVSGTHLCTDIGTMHGTYLVQRAADAAQFEAHIPRFLLLADFRKN